MPSEQANPLQSGSTASTASNPADKPKLTPEQGLALLKARLDFYKFMAGSVAVALITASLTFLINAREEKLKEVMQDNTNLNSYVQIALETSTERQVRLAQFFETLSGDPKAQDRWKNYHKVASDLLKSTQDAKGQVSQKKQAYDTAPDAKKEAEWQQAIKQYQTV